MSPDAPTTAELQQHPVVQAAFAAAWADSLTDDPALRHEEGGFIYANPAGDVVVRRVPPGAERYLDLTIPPAVPGYFVVATFHTHPTLIVDGGNPDPSPDDRLFADDSGVPWFVVSELGVTFVGPDSRVGGLAGPEGYPQ